MTDSELLKAIKEIDNAEEIYSLKKEQVENAGFDAFLKDGFLFFICIKENIENDNWFNDILNGYTILCEILYSLDNPKEKDFNQNSMLRLGLILVETCEDYFVSHKISESEMSERIDTVMDIQQYLLYVRIAKLLGITLNSTKEDLSSFFSYFMTCYQKWYQIFPSELSNFKGFKNVFKIECPIESPFEEVTFDKSLVDIFFKKITTLILSNKNSLIKFKNKELINVEAIKRELTLATYEIKFSGLNHYQELNTTIKLLNEWIKIEKDFIDEISSSLVVNPSEDESPSFKNNFDRENLDEFIILEYFQTKLVKSDLLSEPDLKKYLECAFEKQDPPKYKFAFSTVKKWNIEDIRRIFYEFYNEKAGRPYGKKREYANLLGQYFVKFDTDAVYNNFNK